MKTDTRSPATRANKPGRAAALAIYLLIATILVPGGAGQTALAAPPDQETPPSRLPYDGAFDLPYLQTSPAPEQALQGVTEPEYVNWSKLVFQSYRNGHDWEIYTARGDGSNQVNLSNNGSMDIYPRLSRDATRVAFASNRHGNYEIFVMNANGGIVKLSPDHTNS